MSAVTCEVLIRRLTEALKSAEDDVAFWQNRALEATADRDAAALKLSRVVGRMAVLADKAEALKAHALKLQAERDQLLTEVMGHNFQQLLHDTIKS